MLKIAHRGYVSNNCCENSSAAILKAIELDYDMVEIDIRETKDQKIVLSHDQNLNRIFGLDKKVSKLTLKEIQAKTRGKILTLEAALKLCKNEIGLLIEVKDKKYSIDFLEEVYQLVKEYNLTSQVLIPPRKDLIEFYLGKLKVGISYSQVKEWSGEENLAAKVFVLGMPNVWNEKKIRKMHDKNLLCLTTVKRTYFARNFPAENHLRLAKAAIQRLKKLEIDAVNIDSWYHQFLFDG